MSSFEYYEDSSQHGNYQYVTLNNMINDYMTVRDSDDYTATTPRYKILYQAKRGLRELYYDILREVRAIELDLSPTLTVILPPDFVNYVRISWVGDDGLLHPMAVDNKMSIAQVYLQDNNFELLFDNEGCVLQGDGLPAGATSVELMGSPDSDNNTCYSVCHDNFLPNKDNSRVFPNGKFRLDSSAGIIQFGSDAMGKRIVLEYISDGVYTGCEGQPEENIRVHKFAESALLSYIYYGLIERRRSVPANEKARARKEYFNNRRLAKRRINALTFENLKQVFKGDSKWIKN